MIRKRIADRVVVASVSGGKDSAAMSLYLTELGIEHRRVFMDTGWEHEATYDYLRGELTRVLGPIEEIRATEQMEELVRRKGMFPSRQRRFCTTELKIKPMRIYLDAVEPEALNVIGIRAEESAARAKLPAWEWSSEFDCEVWRPLLDWKLDQVIEIHKRHGLRPNPLYLMGASRVGCWPCIMARKGEIRLIADTDPKRIDRLRVLETEVTVKALERYPDYVESERKEHEERRANAQACMAAFEAGVPIELEQYASAKAVLEIDFRPRPFAGRSWFQAPTGRTLTMPIDDVVAWSRTPHGMPHAVGQGELFTPGVSEDGCMRWGMCETAADDESKE